MQQTTMDHTRVGKIIMQVVFYHNEQPVAEKFARCKLQRRMDDVVQRLIPEKYQKFEIDCIFSGKGANRRLISKDMPIEAAVKCWYDCTYFEVHVREAIQMGVPLQAATSSLGHLMVTSSGKLILPRKRIPGNKNQLHNAVVDYLNTSKGHFELDEDREMKFFLNKLVDALWAIDGDQKLISTLPGVPAVPAPFCFPRKFSGTRRLSYPMLNKAATNLPQALKFPFWKRPEWSTVQRDVSKLVQTLKAYVQYLSSPKPAQQFGPAASSSPVHDATSSISRKFSMDDDLDGFFHSNV